MHRSIWVAYLVLVPLGCATSGTRVVPVSRVSIVAGMAPGDANCEHVTVDGTAADVAGITALAREKVRADPETRASLVVNSSCPATQMKKIVHAIGEAGITHVEMAVKSAPRADGGVSESGSAATGP